MRTHAHLLPVGLLVCGVLMAAGAAAAPAQLYVADEGNEEHILFPEGRYSDSGG